MAFAGHIKSTAASESASLIEYTRFPDAHILCRFWSDILLMISAVGQFISSLITILVRLPRALTLDGYQPARTHRYSFRAL